MASAKTEYLGLVIFPDITGVYQRELRLALVGPTGSNMHIIDAALKGQADSLKKLSDSLSKVATSGSYKDLVDAEELENVIPIATTKEAGKVRPDGDTILVDENGIIRAAVKVAIATTDSAGIVKPDGDTILIDEAGVIRAAVKVAIATVEAPGIVKPDGETISIDEDGKLKANYSNAYTKPEVDSMLEKLSDILLSDTDRNQLYDCVNLFMGENTEFIGLGASILSIDALADTLLN